MKTPMNVFNTAMKKKKKNRKGLLPRRTDRRSGHHGNSGRCTGSVPGWLY